MPMIPDRHADKAYPLAPGDALVLRRRCPSWARGAD